MRTNIFFISTLAFLALVACDSKKRVKAPAHGGTGMSQTSKSTGHTIRVEEIVMAPSYMYLRVTEDGKEYWIATNNQPVEVGMTLHFEQGMEMKDFTSKELDRTFESLWFVQKLRSPHGASAKDEDSVSPYGGGNLSQESGVTVDKVAGGVTVAELYASPSAFEGKTVSIRGLVTKFNSRIMGRNWVHLQDGTNHDDHFDITLTTMEEVGVGDVVVFSGTVVLNKDFGAGYVYDIILEEGALAKES